METLVYNFSNFFLLSIQKIIFLCLKRVQYWNNTFSLSTVSWVFLLCVFVSWLMNTTAAKNVSSELLSSIKQWIINIAPDYTMTYWWQVGKLMTWQEKAVRQHWGLLRCQWLWDSMIISIFVIPDVLKQVLLQAVCFLHKSIPLCWQKGSTWITITCHRFPKHLPPRAGTGIWFYLLFMFKLKKKVTDCEALLGLKCHFELRMRRFKDIRVIKIKYCATVSSHH